MKEMGHGAGYVYAHDDQRGAQRLVYLPELLRGKKYYEPSEHGVEGQLKKNLEHLQKAAKPNDLS
jgi:putative ATPase